MVRPLTGPRPRGFLRARPPRMELPFPTYALIATVHLSTGTEGRNERSRLYLLSIREEICYARNVRVRTDRSVI